jgi:hypothetical protein
LQTSGVWHSWVYTLELEVAEDRTICSPTRIAYLDRVVYTTTSIDDGDVLTSVSVGCSEDFAVQPTSQTFSVTDTGANQTPGSFVCYPSDCDGPTLLTITHD